MTALAPTLEAFFSDRLIKQRGSGPNTIAAYRDTFRLLIAYTTDHTNTDPSDLDIGQLDATRLTARPSVATISIGMPSTSGVPVKRRSASIKT